MGLEISILGVLNEVVSFEIKSLRLELSTVEKDLGVRYIFHLKWGFFGSSSEIQPCLIQCNSSRTTAKKMKCNVLAIEEWFHNFYKAKLMVS